MAKHQKLTESSLFSVTKIHRCSKHNRQRKNKHVNETTRTWKHPTKSLKLQREKPKVRRNETKQNQNKNKHTTTQNVTQQKLTTYITNPFFSKTQKFAVSAPHRVRRVRPLSLLPSQKARSPSLALLAELPRTNRKTTQTRPTSKRKATNEQKKH